MALLSVSTTLLHEPAVSFAQADEYPRKQELFSKLPELIGPMQSLHISIDDYLSRLTREVDWNEDARVLTDSYSPGNILMHQER